MTGAVLFDWNNTLVRFTWDDALLEAGHRAALEAIDRDTDAGAFTERYRGVVLDPVNAIVGTDYGMLLRRLLGELTDDEVDRFVDAEHEVWRPAHAVLGSAQALLAALRSRGFKTGVVANSWPEPARVLRRDAADLGLAPHLDTLVFSSEVGVAKPDPRIFMHALGELDVDPIDAVYVGDRLDTDVQGAANVGMTTVQALWFNAHDTPATVE